MAGNVGIDWTERVYNPTTGCTKISSGCKNCYAERRAKRMKAMGMEKYKNRFNLTLHPTVLPQPYHWKIPSLIFVNSMSDLFHSDVPVSYIKKVFKVMRETPHHNYQVLTKRAARLEKLSPVLKIPTNVWIGVSVEDADNWYRVKHLQKVKAAVRFLSIEPLIGPLPEKLNLRGIHWVIVGGESQAGCRPMENEWVHHIRKACKKQKVPFYLKQLGGFPSKRHGEMAILDGKRYRQMPRCLHKNWAKVFA